MHNATDNSLQGLQAAARRQQEREDLIEKDGYLRGWNDSARASEAGFPITLRREYWRGFVHGCIIAALIQITVAIIKMATL